MATVALRLEHYLMSCVCTIITELSLRDVFFLKDCLTVLVCDRRCSKRWHTHTEKRVREWK